MMGLPTERMRSLAISAGRNLHTVRLRDCQFVAEPLRSFFEADCSLTCAVGDEHRLSNVLLKRHGAKTSLRGVHIAVLSTDGQIEIAVGDDHTKVFVGSQTVARVKLQLFRRPTIFIGDLTTIAHARIIGAHSDVVIGDDCQISDEIVIQSNDQHPVIDLATKAVTNAHRRHVTISSHVWIGRRAMIMPDVCIGEGSIVAAGAVVTRDVGAHCSVGGVPARTIRTAVTWGRRFDALSD